MADEKEKFFFQFAKDSYHAAITVLSNLDSKANNLFTIDAALITVITTLTYVILEGLVKGVTFSPSQQFSILSFLFASVIMFLISIFIGIRAYAPTTQSIVDPVVLIDALKHDSYSDVLTRTAVTVAQATKDNTEAAHAKAIQVTRMTWFILLGLVLAAIGFLLFFYGAHSPSVTNSTTTSSTTLIQIWICTR